MIELGKINLKTGSENTEILDFQEITKKCFVDLSEEIKQNPIAISIGKSQYKNDLYPVCFGSYGNFSCIVGQSKHRKSFLKSLLCACYIGGNSNQYAEMIKGHDNQRFVLDFDTEQSAFHAQRVFRRTVEIVGYMPDNYKTFRLLDLEIKERKQYVEYMILESEFRNNLGLVFIDGIADLVYNENDIEESKKMTQTLLHWVSKSKAHINVVIHANWGTKKATGHLGSSIMKKAETVAYIEKDGDICKVTPDFCRNIEFEPFTFQVDKNTWLPYVNNQSPSNIFM